MKTLFTIILSALVIAGFSQSDALRKNQYNVKNDIALAGYDPVSYFEGKPQEGFSGNRIVYKGITYLFSSKTTLEKFKINPSKYEPAYGGWCAYAMGENGEKVKIDAETFKILDGKLYLFYNFWGNNTLEDWNKNEKNIKAKGDKNWQKFIP